MGTLPIININRESLATRSIELLNETGDVILTGSGFVVERDGSRYLVSNAHIFSGLKTNNEYMSATRELPVKARVTFPLGQNLTSSARGTWDLVDENRECIWWQHPEHGRLVDVAVLPIAIDPEVDPFPVPYDGRVAIDDEDEKVRWSVGLRVAQQLYIVGYPLGMNGGSDVLSVWVGATVASEPGMDVDGKRRMIIDGAAREGLSGAPVYAHWPVGDMVPIDDVASDYRSIMLGLDTTVLVGIYSGRFDDRSDLGYAWKPALIDEIITGRKRGTVFADIFGE